MLNQQEDVYTRFYALCRTGTPETRTPEVNAQIAELKAIIDADHEAAGKVIELTCGLTSSQRWLVISALEDQIAEDEDEEDEAEDYGTGPEAPVTVPATDEGSGGDDRLTRILAILDDEGDPLTQVLAILSADGEYENHDLKEALNSINRIAHER